MKFQHRAAWLFCLFLTIAAASICAILLRSHRSPQADALLAEVYQNGVLIHTCRLDQTDEAFAFRVTSEDGGYNLIEVRPGSIGILSADCPDKLCVSQGFISNSLLPVTCLPHRLVIQIRTP